MPDEDYDGAGFKTAGWCLWSTGLIEWPEAEASERKRAKIRGGSFEGKSSSSKGVTVTATLDMQEENGRITFSIDGWKVPRAIVGVRLQCSKVVFAVTLSSEGLPFGGVPSVILCEEAM